MTLSDKLKKALGQSDASAPTTTETAQDYSFAGRLRSASAATLEAEAAAKKVAEASADRAARVENEQARIAQQAAQNRANAITLANAEDIALSRLGSSHRLAQAYNTAREQAISDYVDQKIGDTKFTSRQALEKAKAEARADYEAQERLYEMYSSDYAAERYAQDAQTAYAEAEKAYQQATQNYNDAIQSMRKSRAPYSGDINALRTEVERTRKALDEATGPRDQANQAVRYHKLQNEQKAVLKKYGVSADNPDYKEKSATLDLTSASYIPSPVGVHDMTYDILKAISNGETPAGITAEQAANLRYLYNTQGAKAAREYASLLENAFTTARTTQQAENITNINSWLGRTLAKAGYGVAAGLSQFETGAKNAAGSLTGKYTTDPFAQGSSVIRNSIDNVVGRGAYDLIVTAANMAPSIILAYAGGVPAIGAGSMGVSAGGNAYAQAMAEGKPAFESFMYGTLTGISEAALQSIIGGIVPVASEESVTKWLTGKVSETLGKKAAQEGAKKITKVLAKVAERAAIIGVNSIFEGGEESLQDILEPVFRNICFDENNEFKFFTEEALYSGIIGALSGGLGASVDIAKTDIASKLADYYNETTDKGGKILSKALNGEALTADEVKTIAKDLTFSTALARDTGTTIEGSVKERTAGVERALKTIKDLATSRTAVDKALNGETLTGSEERALLGNPEYVTEIVNKSGVNIEGTNSEMRAQLREAISTIAAQTATTQATETATEQTSINSNTDTQNINVAQNGSQRVTEGIAQNTQNDIADFANPAKNYASTAGKANAATVDPSTGQITANKYDGSSITFNSMRDISEYLVNNLRGITFVTKKPSSRRVAGYYIPSQDLIRARENDVSVISHEVGHWLDEKLDMGKKIGIDALKAAYGAKVLKVGYSPAEVSGELMAEFTREYFTDQDALRSKYPDMVKAFEEVLSTAGDNKAGGTVYDTIRTAADMMNAYISLSEEARYGTYMTNSQVERRRIRNERTTSMREFVNKLIYNSFDSAFPVKIGSETAYVLQTQKNGNLPAIIQGAIVDGVRDIHGEMKAEGWKTIYDMVALGKDKKTRTRQMREFNEYLIMLDILDSLELGQTVFTTETNLNDPNKVKSRINALIAENPQFVEAETKVRAWYDALQQMMVDAGIWTSAQKDKLNELHKHYIGLHRAVNISDTTAHRMKIDAKEGRGYNGIDSIDDMLNYTRKGSNKSIYEAFEQATYFANNVIQRVTDNAIIKTFYEEASQTEGLVAVDNRMNGTEVDSLTYYEDGKAKHFYVNDPLVLNALKWEKPTIGSLHAVRVVTNLTKQLATQYNPAFIVRNIARDVQQAYRNGSENNPIKFMGQWLSALVEVSKSETAEKLGKTDKVSETYQAAQSAGLEGAAPWRGMTSRAMQTYRQEVGLEKKRNRYIRETLTAIADITETTTRYAEVKRQLKKGANMADAVLAGQEVTTNFTRSGASKAYRILDTFIPFLGANIQGTYNNLKQFIDYDPKTGKIKMTEDGANKIAKTIAIWALPTILQYALLLSGSDDEREEKLEYFRGETNFVKNQYWLMWTGDGTFIKVPKSQALQPAFQVIERAFDQMALKDPQAFNSFIGNSVKEFLFDSYVSSQLLFGNFTDITNITGIGTAFALAQNKDWRGQTIDTAEAYDQNISPRLHYDENTSWAAKWLGNVLNWSPQKIDYVVSDIAPIIGSVSQNFTSEKGISDIKRNWADALISGTGLKSGLIADSVYSTDIKREYYNYKDSVNTIANDAKMVYTPKTSLKDAKKFGEGLTRNSVYVSFNTNIVTKINTAIKAMDDPQDKRNANKVLNRLMTDLSATHGETSKGGTLLDKDLAEMYADYTMYADVIQGDSVGYWLSSAKGKNSKGKTETLGVNKILVTDNPVKTCENIAKYYTYVDKMLTDLWEGFSKTPDYKSANLEEKYARFIEERNAACYAALKLIESENNNGK